MVAICAVKEKYILCTVMLSLMSVRRTSFKDSSTYRSVFTGCLLFGDWAYVDVLTSITLLSPE